MLGIIKLREDLHNRVLASKCALNLICKPQFEVLWELSTEEQRNKALEIINSNDIKTLKEWIMKHPSIEPSEMSSKQLLNAAQKLHIPNYSRLCKLELIPAVQRWMEASAHD